MLPSVTFAQTTTLGGARRFALSFLLPLPALYYLVHFGDLSAADTVAVFMREGAVHAARALGAGGPGALFVAAVMGTFVIPMLGFALAWSAGGNMASSQLLLAWLAQALVNTCGFVNGSAPSPASLTFSASLRVPGLEALGLADISMAVGAGFFLLGAALFATALMLPLKYAVESRASHKRRAPRAYRVPVW